MLGCKEEKLKEASVDSKGLIETSEKFANQNGEKHLKLNLELRLKLIEKLNAFSQMIFKNQFLDDLDSKAKWVSENDQLVSELLDLPIVKLITGNCFKNFLNPKKKIIIKHLFFPFLESSINDDTTTKSNHTETEVAINEDNVNSTMTSKREFKLANLEKLIANLDLMMAKIKKFDPKNENITSWFLKYEVYCDIFNWTKSECLFGLTYFFDSGLNRLIFLIKKFDYDTVKENVINFVDNVVNLKNLPFIEHREIQQKMELFNEFGFTTYERMFWFDCYFPLEKIKEFYNMSNDYDQTWEKQFFNQII